MEFSLHFLAFNVPDEILSSSFDHRKAYAFSRPGVLELTQYDYLLFEKSQF